MKKRCISKIVLASSNLRRVGTRRTALIKLKGIFTLNNKKIKINN